MAIEEPIHPLLQDRVYKFYGSWKAHAIIGGNSDDISQLLENKLTPKCDSVTRINI